MSWAGTKIEWQNPNGSDVVIELDDVVAIGEHTTDAGPFFDDWFLTFIYRTGNRDSIPVYADGTDGLKHHLSNFYNTDFSKYFLVNVAEWRSYIRYPKDLEGKPLFVIHAPKDYRKPQNLFNILNSILGIGVYGKSWELQLTDELKSKLTSM